MERWRRHVRGERDGKDARARVRRARAMLRCGVRAQRSGLPRSFRVDFERIPGDVDDSTGMAAVTRSMSVFPRCVQREIKATGLRVEGMMYDMAYTRQVTEGLRAMKTFDALKRQLIYAARLKNEIDRASQYARPDKAPTPADPARCGPRSYAVPVLPRFDRRPSRVEAMSEFSFRGLTELVTPALLGGSSAARANIDPVGVATADAPSPSFDVTHAPARWTRPRAQR